MIAPKIPIGCISPSPCMQMEGEGITPSPPLFPGTGNMMRHPSLDNISYRAKEILQMELKFLIS